MSDWRVRMAAISAVLGVVAGLTTPVGANIPNRDRFDGAAAMPADAAREGGCDPALVPVADVESNTHRLVGQVVSLDERGGQMVLETKAGRVALAATTDTISQLGVGDVVVVEMIPESDTVPARTECR